MAIDPNIKKKADDIRNKIYGKEVRESLASGLEAMSTDVVKNECRQSVVEGRQDSVESQWQSVSDEMTDKDIISAPEIIAARNGEANLKTRIDKDHQEVTAQLAQTSEEITKSKKSFHTKTGGGWGARPIISFTDDDGAPGVLDTLAPIFTSRNVPLTVALINTQGITVDETQRQELLDLQNNHGWEITSHAWDTDDLATLTEDELRTNFENSIQDLTDKGFDVESIIYPYGSADRQTRNVVAEYFRAGFTSSNGTKIVSDGMNDINSMDLYGIKRINIGEKEGRDLQYYLDRIDYAIENNQWLVFYTHAGPLKSLDKTSVLEQVIDYAIHKGVDIITPKDALNYYEPSVQVGDPFMLNDFTKILKNGKVNSNFALEMTRSDAYSANDTIDKYMNPITIFGVSNANAESLGWGEPGTVVTFKGNRTPGYDFQLFFAYGRNEMKLRRVPYSTNLEWSDWVEILTKGQNIIKKELIETYVPSNTTRHNNLGGLDVPVNNSVVLVEPTHALPEGIIYHTEHRSDGNITLRLGNVTNEGITVPSNTWNVKVL